MVGKEGLQRVADERRKAQKQAELARAIDAGMCYQVAKWSGVDRWPCAQYQLEIRENTLWVGDTDLEIVVHIYPADVSWFDVSLVIYEDGEWGTWKPKHNVPKHE